MQSTFLISLTLPTNTLILFRCYFLFSANKYVTFVPTFKGLQDEY